MNSFSEFQEILKEMNLQGYRAQQVWEWIFKKQVFDFREMTNLSIETREKLSEKFPSIIPEELDRLTDPDGTIKIVLPMIHGEKVESVAIPDEDGNMTFCLSSQVGCPVGCVFCRTGKDGFKRNLSAQEIMLQYFGLCRTTRKKSSNIVFMGMGEPFLNQKEVFASIDVMTDKNGLNIGSRRITISTVGIPSGILALSERPGEVNLAVSLHAASDNTRGLLLPINEKHPLEKLRAAIVEYISRTSRRITLEVVLIKGMNDGLQDALNLEEFCRDLLCHINLVRFNPFPGCNYKPSTEQSEKEFRKHLKKAGIPVTIRKSKGASILAACGQLSGK